jgi:superfamily II DNA or RNA helicase
MREYEILTPSDHEWQPHTSDIVSDYIRRFKGMKAIYHVANLAMMLRVVGLFDNAGVRAASVSRGHPPAVRRETTEQFCDGRIEVLVVVDITDLPVCDVVIVARPTKSKTLFSRMLAPALRDAPGRGCATIIDLTTNTLRHGLPEDLPTRNDSVAR